MNQYLVKLSVDGRRTEVTVSAHNENDARKIAQAQFSGCDVRVINSKRV